MSNLTTVRDDELVSSEINTIVSEIKIIKNQTSKILLNSAMEIGKRLKEAKSLVGHGNWEKWLEEKVEYSKRTATNLMRLYDEYGSKSGEDLNRKLVADLGYTQAIAMLKLDFEDRENLMITHDVEEMSVKEIEKEVQEKLALKKEKEALEKQLEDELEKGSELSKSLEEKLKKIEEYESKMKEKTEEIKELKSKASQGEKNLNPEELEKANAELEKKKQEIKELKAKLKEKPKEVEVEVEKVIEVLPGQIEMEINELKVELSKANSKLNSSESVLKFKSTFDLTVNLFNELLQSLNAIEDEGERERYKSAVNKFLERLTITD